MNRPRRSLTTNPAVKAKARKLTLDPEQLRCALRSMLAPDIEPMEADVQEWLATYVECGYFLYGLLQMHAREQAIRAAGGGREGLDAAKASGALAEAMNTSNDVCVELIARGKARANIWLDKYIQGNAV